MTDAELADFLCLSPDEAAIIVPRLTPKKCALYRRMAEVEGEIMLWQAGVGKMPEGVILCGRKQIKGAGKRSTPTPTPPTPPSQ